MPIGLRRLIDRDRRIGYSEILAITKCELGAVEVGDATVVVMACVQVTRAGL